MKKKFLALVATLATPVAGLLAQAPAAAPAADTTDSHVVYYWLLGLLFLAAGRYMLPLILKLGGEMFRDLLTHHNGLSKKD